MGIKNNFVTAHDTMKLETIANNEETTRWLKKLKRSLLLPKEPGCCENDFDQEGVDRANEQMYVIPYCPCPEQEQDAFF